MTDKGTIGGHITAAGVPLVTLEMRRGAADPRGLWRLGRLLARRRPAILQTWLYHADLLGLVAHRLGWTPRLVWNIRCTEAVEAGGVRAVLARASRRPDVVIVNAQAGRRFHESLGYRPRRWEYVPNGIDAARFRPDPEARRDVRARLGIDAHTVAIGLPARWHRMKDHATFLAAAARLAARRQNLILLLAGRGIDAANRDLAAAIVRAGPLPPFRLLGDHHDMPGLYAALDIATLSSAFGEGFPNVLGEAMACGVPCVATDSGDAAEILGPCGEVVPPRDPAALAAAWERLVAAGVERRRALGAAARARVVGHYGLAVMVRRYEAIWDGLLPPASEDGPRLVRRGRFTGGCRGCETEPELGQ
jgi:glycosyltransferase involved in cell wall biosynthesis